MFPKVDIVRWRKVAPWADDDDVEQDLSEASLSQNVRVGGSMAIIPGKRNVC